ncbi:hypothetical protein F4703DRAFT_1792818 [Phycomyces blakesleeanus]|uniref:Uncharacterized protein n=1 Tax=Phycomyces blakesleeanus (strain ATCC 8743b / DSM 1359 / FGSC 10004 / NBRC 33097 / NRRL 1555) TaxID=763407 RepID=A0A163BEE1_PHYB8|nr:hypothetical protein PHYBLDRAFT_62100 [Phycomyces blakesleeanus NRRL 1555(-)]OAD81051.1 hypothetical protein PHYBLDRAFT_62100 [Phycomyces blakesleeanus NRRL 1555(-)]|eukprot:XP_018299091.1 hypothetical protein PHYBLDRAFT_62100 [Phycomyces blakesleeanus NRRL 1555(-)]
MMMMIMGDIPSTLPEQKSTIRSLASNSKSNIYQLHYAITSQFIPSYLGFAVTSIQSAVLFNSVSTELSMPSVPTSIIVLKSFYSCSNKSLVKLVRIDLFGFSSQIFSLVAMLAYQCLLMIQSAVIKIFVWIKSSVGI